MVDLAPTTEPLSPEQVSDLIRIADARIKEWRGSWYTFGIPVPRRFTLEEQLEAVQHLGTSRTAAAFEYLSRLLDPVHERVSMDPAQGGGDYGGTEYPNARGKLRRRLSSSWVATYGPADAPRIDQDARVYNICKNALDQCGKDLSRVSSP